MTKQEQAQRRDAANRIRCLLRNNDNVNQKCKIKYNMRHRFYAEDIFPIILDDLVASPDIVEIEIGSINRLSNSQSIRN